MLRNYEDVSILSSLPIFIVRMRVADCIGYSATVLQQFYGHCHPRNPTPYLPLEPDSPHSLTER